MKDMKFKKHKQSKYFTLMLVPYSSSKTKSIRIPHNIIYFIAAIGVFIASMFLFSYLQVREFKTVADENKESLEKEIEKNWELIKQNNQADINIMQQRENYEKQKESYNQKIKGYENELKTYEEKAAELDKKIQELDKAKTDIYDILSEKIGFEPEIALTSANTGNSASANYTFLNNSSLVSNDISFLSHTSETLEIVYNDLELKLADEIKSFESLKSEVLKYKPYIQAMPNIWPVYGRITSNFGSRSNPFTGRSTEYHSGLDIKASTGTPIKVTGAGTVIFSGWQNGYGNVVEVEHGYGIVTLYAHNSRLNVSVGQKVSRGDTIAFAGSTGRSTGSHCHYEVKINGERQDPKKFLK